jgi:transposase
MDSLTDITLFLKGSSAVSFKTAFANRAETYKWIEETLVRFSYMQRKKKERGLLRKYIQKMTGYSRSQIRKCITQYMDTGRVKLKVYTRNSFATVYTDEDIRLLSETDALHQYPNGVTLKAILKRMVTVYKVMKFEKLSQISVSQIYVFRQSPVYLRMNLRYEKTKPKVVNLGERKKPEPNGHPGCIRVDTVHQGDKQKDEKGRYVKGVYHINMVSEVTQFEVIGATEKINERSMEIILTILLEIFPFEIIEFHSDNGGEYINEIVVNLLNKLLIRLTKSRSRKSNDNALVESKNGSIIRKWMGYDFIDQKHAERINEFNFGCFLEYINYHRPCAFPTEIKNAKGKIKKIYKPEDYMTPYQKLKSLPNAEQYLRPGITFEMLDEIAMRRNDNEMAQIVQKERRRLFDEVIG